MIDFRKSLISSVNVMRSSVRSRSIGSPYPAFLGSRASRNIRPLPWWIVYG
jgi:hypothetical protein